LAESDGLYEVRSVPTVLGKINVRTIGLGPAMVCWPSLLMSGAMWRGQVDRFGPAHRMVLIDPPGHGGSEPLQRTFTLVECAVCLAQVLDDLAIDACILMGNSWGGMMGGVFAALYPRRTRAAVLMNCTASAPGVRQRLEFYALASLLRRLTSVPQPLINRAVKAFAGETTERTKPDVIGFIQATVSALNARSVSWAVESVVPRRVDHHDLLQAIRSPVLVMTGEEDRTFPVSETRTMADAIPGAQFIVLSKVGHLAALEAPEQVNSEIESFLATV